MDTAMRTTLAVVLATTSWLCQAQSPYRPFPEANAGWVETHSRHVLGGPSGDDISSCHRTIEFGSDTAINDTIYHELLIRGICDPFDDPYTEAEHTFCWFRQDIGERKVHVFDPAVQHGVLWFDFSLSIGPYPSTWGHVNPDPIHVVALDSVQLNDGWHRSWVLGYVGNDGIVFDSAFCSVIEGIGSTFGLDPLYGLVYPFEWVDVLECHNVNGMAIYPDGAEECNLTMGSPVPEVSVAALRVLPNPAQEAIWLDLAQPTNAALYQILDPAGRRVAAGTVNSGITKLRVDISALDAGLYTVRCDLPGMALRAARFIKE